MEVDVEQYFPLVHSIARKNRNRADFFQIEYDDLVGIGMIGLAEAYKRYKNDKGATFLTFATIVINGRYSKYFRDMGIGKRNYTGWHLSLEDTHCESENELGDILSDYKSQYDFDMILYRDLVDDYKKRRIFTKQEGVVMDELLKGKVNQNDIIETTGIRQSRVNFCVKSIRKKLAGGF